PPRCQPCPYTTLFRSRHENTTCALRDVAARRLHAKLAAQQRIVTTEQQLRRGTEVLVQLSACIGIVVEHERRRAGRGLAPIVDQDRKSTRLNSSHEWI